jgi:hypothetical protein
MFTRLRPAAALLLIPAIVHAQQSQPTSNPPPAVSQQTSAVPAVTAPTTGKFMLEDGMPLKIRLGRTISSADSKVGDTVEFEVLEEVKVEDIVVIPQGGIAWASVTEAEHKKRMGRGGKLNITIDAVRLTNGQKAPLRAVKETQGGGHVGAMTGAIVATAIVIWPAAPFFLFMHGKDITIPKGTAITAFVNGNVPLDKSTFVAKVDAPKPEIQQSSSAIISSNPSGADIEVDGAYVGNSPSTISLSLGQHTIAVKKKGFKDWERKLQASTGSINVAANLEAAETAPATNTSVPSGPPSPTTH